MKDAEALANKLKLQGRARGIILGRYIFKGSAGRPITSFEELCRMSDVDLLKRPGCGHKTLKEIREAIRWANAN